MQARLILDTLSLNLVNRRTTKRVFSMEEKLIISISGLRGIVGENLTPSIAAEYGCAFGTFLKDKYERTTQYAERNTKSVCIGRDSRTSGQMLKAAVSSGLCASGIDVIDLGLVTTPSVAVMVKELRCSGGAVITASHNPIQYNGIKLLLDNGIAPPIDKAGQIKIFFLEKRFSFADSADCGKITCNNQADTHHIKKVLAIVDKSTIAARKFKVVLDSVNGAGSPVTKKLLAELGCEVIARSAKKLG